ADVPPLARGRFRAAPDRRHRGTVHVPHGPAASTTSPLPAATGSERDRVPDGTRGAGGGRAMGSVPHARARAAAPARAAADRAAWIRRLFPHSLGHRALRPPRGDPLPGSRLRCELRRLLLPW